MTALLDYVELNSTQKEIGCVIWLHGLGADGNDFLSVAKELSLPFRFIFPHAPLLPVTINNGYVMRAWYDIYSLGEKDHRVDHEGIALSVKNVTRIIENEIQRGTTAEKIVLAGFSQGALIALMTGLQYSKKLAGIIALSGYLPYAEKVVEESQSKGHIIPIFIAHGTQDSVVPYFLGKQVSEVLQNNQYPVSWHDYPMAHSVCINEINDIKKWLKNIFLENSKK